MNYWPLYGFLDHAWYLGVSLLPSILHAPGLLWCDNLHTVALVLQVDVGNEACMGMKPAGWWGWKFTVATAKGITTGTFSDIEVSWKCGTQPMTNGVLPLDCTTLEGISWFGEMFSGGEDINCFAP